MVFILPYSCLQFTSIYFFLSDNLFNNLFFPYKPPYKPISFALKLAYLPTNSSLLWQYFR